MSESVIDTTNTHSQVASEPTLPQKPTADASDSRVFRALKTTGKVAGKLSALDVLWKDGRRVRPRNPELWRDIFSRKGWNAAIARAQATPAHPLTPATVIVPLVYSGFGFAIALYSLLMIVAHPLPSAIPVINKVVIVLMLLVSSAYAFIYLTIFGMQFARYRRLKRPAATRGSCSK
ncbi:hypothetical protein [Marinobacter sp. MBR-105]|jgi:hypothetical protein